MEMKLSTHELYIIFITYVASGKMKVQMHLEALEKRKKFGLSLICYLVTCFAFLPTYLTYDSCKQLLHDLMDSSKVSSLYLSWFLIMHLSKLNHHQKKNFEINV